MQLIKKLKIWFLVVVILIIAALSLWPFFKLTGDRNWLPTHMLSDFINQETLPVAQEAAPEKITENILVFGGDIMLSRSVNGQMEKFQDYSWPFEKIYSLFSEADLAIANLESPFLVSNKYVVPTGSFSFKANPKSIEALKLAGFDVLSLANNHMLNQGLTGLKDTSDILSGASIGFTGKASANLVVKESRGIKFGFLSYTYAADSSLIANMLKISQLKTDIKEAKKKSDVVIVMMHAGTEYKKTPNDQQIAFAHAAVDNGADLVIGTHPHWIQTVEQYQGKTIIYSLGNLIFDQMWSHETSIGLVVKAYFMDKKLDKIEYIPINIKNYGQAEIMPDGVEKDAILKSLNDN